MSEQRVSSQTFVGSLISSTFGFVEVIKLAKNLNLWLRVVLVLGVMLSVLQVNPYTTNPDSVVYLTYGRSLWSGVQFHSIWEPGVGQAVPGYPPVYPWLLGAVMWLTGHQEGDISAAVLPSKLLSVLFYVLALLVLCQLLRRYRVSRGIGSAVVGLTALNPVFVRYASEMMSELSYTFFSLAAILLCERAADQKDKPTRFVAFASAAVLTILLAYYVRSIGLVLVMAVSIHMLLLKTRRSSRVLLVLALLGLVLLFFVWQAQDGRSSMPYFRQLVLADNYAPQAQALSLSEVAWRWVYNARAYLPLTVGSLLGFSENSWEHVRRHNEVALFLLLASVPIGAGFLALTRQSRRLSELYVLLYVCVLLTWQWTSDRFLVPILPFLIFYFVVGLGVFSSIVRRFSPSLVKVGVPLVVLLLLVTNVLFQARAVQRNLRGTSAGVASKYFENVGDIQMARFFEAVEWTRDHSESEDIVVSRYPELTFLYSSRRGIEPPRTLDSAEALVSMTNQGVSYVIEDTFLWPGLSQLYVRPVIERHQHLFTRVYETGSPTVRVWKWVR